MQGTRNYRIEPPVSELGFGALGGTRTPNLLIRSQMLYPLSYKREFKTNESLRCVESSSLAER